MAAKPLCKIDGCDKPVHQRGWCNAHYKRWWRHGDPLAGGPSLAAQGEPLRWVSEVALPFAGRECLTWPFSRAGGRYGKVKIGGKNILAHRLICERAHGPAPSPDHEAAHSCGKGHLGCVNPNHLVWKTRVANRADRIAHGTHNYGERQGTSKLTEADVLEIRAMHGRVSGRALAKRYGVTPATISKVQLRRSWFWLD